MQSIADIISHTSLPAGFQRKPEPEPEERLQLSWEDTRVHTEACIKQHNRKMKQTKVNSKDRRYLADCVRVGRIATYRFVRDLYLRLRIYHPDKIIDGRWIETNSAGLAEAGHHNQDCSETIAEHLQRLIDQGFIEMRRQAISGNNYQLALPDAHLKWRLVKAPPPSAKERLKALRQ